MTKIIKNYRLICLPENSDSLVLAVEKFIEEVKEIPGFISATILREHNKDGFIDLLEQWDNRDAHLASASRMPKDKLKHIISLLSEPPELREFSVVADICPSDR